MKVTIQEKEIKLVPETEEEKQLLDILTNDQCSVERGHIYNNKDERKNAEFLTIYRSGFGTPDDW